MPIVFVWSSPNEKGLTAAAKNNILKGVADAGREFEVIHLNSLHIEHCRICGNGWGLCAEEGRCCIDDDLAEVYRKLCTTEGIVWVSAVYWHDLTENLKSLLDRIRRCETGYNHLLKGKKCLLAACAGGSGLGATKALVRLEETLSHMKMIAIDRLPVTQFNKEYMLPALRSAGQSFSELCIANQL